MITSILPKQNISFKGAKFHLNPLELDTLRKEKAAQETLFAQGGTGECWVLAAVRSTMFTLNEYAKKTGKHCYDARNWIKKLVTLDEASGARICFPSFKSKFHKFNVTKNFLSIYTDDFNDLSQGNKRMQFLEAAYSMFIRVADKSNIDDICASQSLNGGFPFLAIRDITGLKSFQLTQRNDTRKQKDLFEKYTGILFKNYKKHPEQLIVTLSTDKEKPYLSFQYCRPFWLSYNHAYSLKKVVDDGLIIVNPHSQTNVEIKVSYNDFYRYFMNVDFARIQPEKMFNSLEKAKQTTAEIFDSRVFRLKKHIPSQIRDSKEYVLKNDVYFDIEDKIN